MLLVLSAWPAQGLGQSFRETSEQEASTVLWQELFQSETQLTREYQAFPWQRVVVTGEMSLKIQNETTPSLRIQGNRALLGQLSVRTWEKTLYVTLDSSLLGPRERGRLAVTLSAPDLTELNAVDRVRIEGDWISSVPVRLSLRSESLAELRIQAPTLNLELNWNSRATLQGVVDRTELVTKDTISADLRGLKAGRLNLDLRGRARVWVGTSGELSGTVGRGGILYVSDARILDENSSRLKLEGQVERF